MLMLQPSDGLRHLQPEQEPAACLVCLHSSWCAVIVDVVCRAQPIEPCVLQVGFHNQKDVRKVKVEKKNNDIINRLEKTRQERSPDLAAEKEVRSHEQVHSC